MQALTTLDETSMSSITSTSSTSSSQTSSLNDYDWLVGRTVWVKWFLHKQDLWYKCKVHYGQKCEYVVQSTKDSIARFPGVYEFFPSGFDFNNERADHVWQLTYFDTSNIMTPAHTKSIKCRKSPRPGDIVMVKWTSWGVNPPWYCCVVRKGNSKNCPLVVESYKTSDRVLECTQCSRNVGENFTFYSFMSLKPQETHSKILRKLQHQRYEFWPYGKDDKNESVDHIWERVCYFLKTKDKTPCSTNEKNYVPDVKRNYRSKSLLPKPFVLPPSPRTKEKQLKEQIIKTSIVRERVECPPNLKPGDEVMFKYGDRMFNYTIPDNLPKSRMMDLCFPVDITELDRSLKLT